MMNIDCPHMMEFDKLKVVGSLEVVGNLKIDKMRIVDKLVGLFDLKDL
jgi:hypothetical protein